MAKPKVEERLRLIEDILDELRERDTGTAVLVEGDRDVAALTALGVPGPVLKINVGVSMLNFCEAIAKEHKAFVVLMDWDKKGQQLAARLETLLTSTGVQVDMTSWRRLGRILPYQIHEVESLDSHIERLRAEVGLR
jgi:dTMP kinase